MSWVLARHNGSTLQGSSHLAATLPCTTAQQLLCLPRGEVESGFACPAGRKSFGTACHAARSPCLAGKPSVWLSAAVVVWSRSAAVWRGVGPGEPPFTARLRKHPCTSPCAQAPAADAAWCLPPHPSSRSPPVPPDVASCTSATAWPSPLCASWARGCPLRRATALSSARSTPVRWLAGWACCKTPAHSLAGVCCTTAVRWLASWACCKAAAYVWCRPAALPTLGPCTAVCRGLAEAAWSHVGCLPHVPVLPPLLSPCRREGWASYLDMERPALHDRHCRGPGPHAGLHRNWWAAAAAVLYSQRRKPLVALLIPG